MSDATATDLNGSDAFAFAVPVSLFTKASAPTGQQRRIAGIISTDRPDQQQETILQRGLDFSGFLKNGFFNDNHSKATTDVVGWPESVQSYTAGQTLPDGQRAPADCTWTEGYLLDTAKAKGIWELAQALQPTNRRLGFSVEGQILKRQGVGGKTIARAAVKHVAVCLAPVNADARLEVLARSLDAIEKDMTVGTSTQVPLDQNVTGVGSAQLLAPEDLEDDLRDEAGPKARKRRVRKSMTDGEAKAWLLGRLGRQSAQLAPHYLNIHKALVAQGYV